MKTNFKRYIEWEVTVKDDFKHRYSGRRPHAFGFEVWSYDKEIHVTISPIEFYKNETCLYLEGSGNTVIDEICKRILGVGTKREYVGVRSEMRQIAFAPKASLVKLIDACNEICEALQIVASLYFEEPRCAFIRHDKSDITENNQVPF